MAAAADEDSVLDEILERLSAADCIPNSMKLMLTVVDN